MGEYRLDTADTYIIVDGHTCIEVKPNIYKVIDSYVINPHDWERDRRNIGLYIIADVENERLDRASVLYIGSSNYCDIQEFVNTLKPLEGHSLLVTLCIFNGTKNTNVIYDYTVATGGEKVDI